MVVRNANIITLDTGKPRAQAMAIEGSRIIFTGSDDAARAHIKPATRVIDAGGRTIIPGLMDSHIHAIRAGLTPATEVTFDGARTIAGAMRRIMSAAQTTAADEWIVVAGGWTPQQFAEGRKPSLREVTAAAQGRNVYIQLFYREVFVSPKGMQALGLTTQSLPIGAVPERDTTNRPTGWIAGKASAITAIYARLPHTGLAERMRGTRRFFSRLNAYGVTGVIDPGGYNIGLKDYDALFALWRKNQLTLRVAYSICAPTPGRELEEYKRYVKTLPSELRRPTGDSFLRFNGIGERVTWGFYNNDNPSPQETRAFEQTALWTAESGLTMTVHWNRSQSVPHLLNALKRVAEKRPFAHLRWSVAHLHDAQPQTIRAVKALNLGWLMQNAHYFAAPSFVAKYAQSLTLAPPIGTALRIGLPVGGGTDASRVMSYNPFAALQWMLDGRTVNGLPTRIARERPTREQALRIWTQGSAWFAFAERQQGTLAPGMLADFAILSQDYMSVPVREIGAIQSLLTSVGGRIVHTSAPFAK